MAKNKARFQFEQGLNFFHKEDYAQASTYFEEAVVEDPQYSEALYNLACCYSMLGDKHKALTYLGRATKLNPHCQDWAGEDREFNGLREDPIFKSILSGEESVGEEQEPPPTELEKSLDSAASGEEDFKEAEFEQVDSTEAEQETDATVSDEEIHESDEPPPNLDDGTPKVEPVKSDYPPCLRCEGLVDVERRPIYDPKFSLAIIYIGIAMSCGLFFTFYGIIGLPVVAIGLYLFSRIKETWVCQNCGAQGEECGQPPETKEVKQTQASA